MTKRYAVWIEIEEITDEGTPDEKYVNLDAPFPETRSFATFEAAMAWATALHNDNKED